MCALIRVKLDEKWRKKEEKNEKSELSEMARTLIKKTSDFLADEGVGGFRVFACADTLARTPLGVRQYLFFTNKTTFQTKTNSYFIITGLDWIYFLLH